MPGERAAQPPGRRRVRRAARRPARTRRRRGAPRAAWRRRSSPLPARRPARRTSGPASAPRFAPRHGTDRAELLRHADIAMYLSKTRKTELEVYVPEEDRHSRERHRAGRPAPGAIEGDQLVLHFQPKVELATRPVTGVEALVRWRHPDRGMLGPNEFLPLAEQHGLMRRLTLQVLRQALRSAGGWRSRHRAADRREHLRGQPARPRLPQRRRRGDRPPRRRPRARSSSSSRRTR